MAWIARDGNLNLCIFDDMPKICVSRSVWIPFYGEITDFIELPSDADEKLIGRHITWGDEPVEI